VSEKAEGQPNEIGARKTEVNQADSSKAAKVTKMILIDFCKGRVTIE